jgi:hypothetical protein
VPRHRWVPREAWTGSKLDTWTERDGAAWLVERWLRAFGPGTERDLKWWTGTTLGLVRGALADVGAVEVAISDGTGWLLPDDLEPEQDVEPWAALLPSLDSTTMGWQQRGWYLDARRAADLVDSAGNAGPTAWWNGRVVGGWRQNDHGVVELQGLKDVGREARAALGQQAERVTEWCQGVRVMLTHPTPLARRLASGENTPAIPGAARSRETLISTHVTKPHGRTRSLKFPRLSVTDVHHVARMRLELDQPGEATGDRLELP